jgi:hypothetical protein
MTMDWFYPVLCTHCGGVYDAGSVTVTARYADCSMWVSPCCRRTVDDRDEGWKSRPDIRKLTADEANRLTRNGEAKLRHRR